MGPQFFGHTYEPAMFPSWEKALMKASATARFAGGRGIELETQDRRTMRPAYACAISRNQKVSPRIGTSKKETHKEERDISCRSVHSRDSNDKSNDSHKERDRDMEESFPRLVCMSRVDERNDPIGALECDSLTLESILTSQTPMEVHKAVMKYFYYNQVWL